MVVDYTFQIQNEFLIIVLGVNGKIRIMGTTKETLEFLANIHLPIQYPPRILTLGVQQGVSLKELYPFAKIQAMDISDYEGADWLSDLNNPVDPFHHDRYDLVFDGGTLEHVFNLIGGLENCYNMLKPGGVFVSHQTMNFCGHGFYQLCPEFFYKWAKWMGMVNARCWVYSPTGSGLKIVEHLPERREEFESFSHLYILFSAEKTANTKIMLNWPQQAGPSKAGKIEHWCWNTKLWSRIPVPKEERVSRKVKLNKEQEHDSSSNIPT